MVAKIELRCIAMFILLTIAYDTFIRAQDVGSPSNVTGCNGETVTTSCPFEYYDVNGTYRGVPHWMVFDGSGESLIFTLTDNESKNGFYYPSPGINDSEAKLIVQVNPKIDGYHVACRLALIEPGPIDSPNTGTIKVIDYPSCPKNISIQNAELNFIFHTSVVILTWHQSNAQPVTFTTVTYCPKSSPNCGNGINCTSPCNISGLNPGTEYQFTIIPYNKCGTPLTCRENTANLTTKIINYPSCPKNISIQNAELNFIFHTSVVILTWHQSNTEPVTFTTVTYCPKSSPNCGNSINCTSPCAISGLNPGTEYQFTIIPYNKCGTPFTCRENTADLTTEIISIPPPVADIPVEWLIAGSVLLVALILIICFVSMIICRRYCYKSLQGCLEIFRNRATKNKVNDTKRKEDEIGIGVVDLSEHTGSTTGSTTQPI